MKVSPLKTLLRDGVVEAIAGLPLKLRLWLYRHCTRLVLGILFRLESRRIVVVRAGPTPYRHRMHLSWQADTGWVLGVYEPHVVQALERFLKRGDCCMDVGANLGYFTSVMSNLVGEEGEVIAFEPLPANIKVLEENIALEGLTNVRIEAKAVGDSIGTASLLIQGDTDFTGTASLAEVYDWGGERTNVSVQVVTLDSYVAGLRKAPSLLKMDVEGAELMALQGANTLLSTRRPILLIEIHGWGSPLSDEVVGLLKKHQYDVEILGLRNRESFCLAQPVERRTDH
jgi:FkbM family methyltransferase